MDYWNPTIVAFGVLLDALPPERREWAVEQLKLAATVQANHCDHAAEYFLRALAGEEFPAPQQEVPKDTAPLQFSRFRTYQGGKP
jgi:hypothetical protein